MLPLVILFKVLPVNMASALGGIIAKTIGPHIAASSRATKNIQYVWPERGVGEQRDIVKGMWENLGRTVAEYPHLSYLSSQKTELIIPDETLKALESAEQPVILFSGHLANWEVAGACLTTKDIGLSLIYRHLNNPYLDAVLKKYRSLNGRIPTIPKSVSGTREYIKRMKAGENIAMLIDQKYNPGVVANFFGKPARTASTFIELGLKYNCLLVPVQIERLEQPTSFRVTVGTALEIQRHERKEDTVAQTLAHIHELMEGWIMQRPEQWFWLHRRWGKI